MNWKYTINIKDNFEENTSKKLVVNLSNKIIYQLKRIIIKINRNLSEDDKYYQNNLIEELIEKFEFIIELTNIKPENYYKYDFNGNFENIFNEGITELYDVGDTLIEKNTKFIWIK